MTDPHFEGSLDETAHLATALAMAISGMGKLAVDEGDEQRALLALRCSATSKRTKKPCMAPALRGWTVCRFHGARGGRPPTTGLHTKQAKAERRALSELLRQSRKTIAGLNE